MQNYSPSSWERAEIIPPVSTRSYGTLTLPVSHSFIKQCFSEQMVNHFRSLTTWNFRALWIRWACWAVTWMSELGLKQPEEATGRQRCHHAALSCAINAGGPVKLCLKKAKKRTRTTATTQPGQGGPRRSLRRPPDTQRPFPGPWRGGGAMGERGDSEGLDMELGRERRRQWVTGLGPKEWSPGEGGGKTAAGAASGVPAGRSRSALCICGDWRVVWGLGERGSWWKCGIAGRSGKPWWAVAGQGAGAGERNLRKWVNNSSQNEAGSERAGEWGWESELGWGKDWFVGQKRAWRLFGGEKGMGDEVMAIRVSFLCGIKLESQISLSVTIPETSS